MKNAHLLNLILIFTTFVFSIDFIKTYGGELDDDATSVKQTSDGGYIITGSTESFGAGGSDVWLIKTDSLGNEEWNRTFGDTANESAQIVVQTNDNGYIIVGSLGLLKTDSLGNEESRNDFEYDPDDIIKTDDGFVFLHGNGIITKTDFMGNEIWTEYLYHNWPNNSYTYPEHLQQINDGGYIVTGYIYAQHYDETWGYMWYEYHTLLIKADEFGIQEWGSSYAFNIRGKSVKQTADNGFIISGYNYEREELGIIKFNESGNSVWMNSEPYYCRYGTEVLQNVDSTYTVIGSVSDEDSNVFGAFIKNYNQDGDLIWTKEFTGDPSQRSLGIDGFQTSDEGYVIAGYTEMYGAGGTDVWLIKTDPEGNATSIDNKPLEVLNYQLCQNYPNPFNPETTISYSLINNGQVSLIVYDIAGTEVCNLVDQKQSKGSHKVNFDGSMLTSGIYFYSLSIDGKAVENRKMMLLK